jgi:hypothetical protein
MASSRLAPPRGARSQPHRLRAPACPCRGSLLGHHDQNRQYSDFLLHQRNLCGRCSRGRNSSSLAAASFARRPIGVASSLRTLPCSVACRLVSMRRALDRGRRVAARPHPLTVLRSARRQEDTTADDAVFEHVVVFEVRPNRRTFEDQRRHGLSVQTRPATGRERMSRQGRQLRQ